MKSLSIFIKENESLKILKVNNGGNGPEGTEILCNALLDSNLKLKVIEMERNQLQDKGASFIAKVLEYMKSYETFNLSQNKIRKEYFTNIIKSASLNTELTEIKIADNSMPLEAVKEFCILIGKCLKLRKFDLSDNLLKGESIIKILNALLDNNSNIEEIYFNGNEIDEGKEIVNEIFESLIKLKSVKKINVSENSFGKSYLKKYGPKFQQKGITILIRSEDE